ncbi:MAG: ABC transporter substrate-binding protein [Acetobacteraceae bacterium]|nr:ABC transporter substrate-binding protein [Acetobacteraceae bacterium]
MMIGRRVLVRGVAAAALARPQVIRAQSLIRVNFLLPAPRFLTAFAPHNLAEARGYYREAGVEMEFTTVAGGAQVATQVGAGNAPLGGGTGDTPIIVRANGVPIRGVSLLGGGTLISVVARPDRGIASLRDLRGKRISVTGFQDTAYFTLLGVLGSVGLTARDVDIQAHGPTGVWQLFVQGQVDAMAGVPDWIVDAQASGVAPIRLSTERDFPSMAQAIIASDRAIRENAAGIRGCVRAINRALADLIRDPAGSARDLIAWLQARNMPANIERLPAVIAMYAERVYAGQQVIGAFDAQRMDAVQRFYADAGIIRRTTPVAELFTNEFVQG